MISPVLPAGRLASRCHDLPCPKKGYQSPGGACSLFITVRRVTCLLRLVNMRIASDSAALASL